MEKRYIPDKRKAKTGVSLRTKLILVNGALLLAAIFAISAILFVSAERILSERILSSLAALASAKEHEIAMMVEKDFEHLALIGSRRYAREYLVRRAVNDPETEKYRIDAVKSLVDAKRASASIRAIDIVDLKGSVAASSASERTGRDVSGAPLFLKGKEGCFLGDLYLEGKSLMYDIWAPLFHPEKVEVEVVGVIRVTVGLSSMFEIVYDRTGLGATGEIQLAKRVGDSITFITSSRHQPGAFLSMVVPAHSEIAEPMRLAVEGKEGIVTALDYRGVRVLAAHRYIPVGGWGLVAKIDAKEAFGPIRTLRWYVMITAILILFLSVIIIMLFSTRITVPLRRLSEATGRLAGGDLEYRLKIASGDEIGQLGSSFNAMAESLQRITASRDELNEEVGRRKETEEKMREAAEYIALTFRLTPSAIFTVDTDRRVTAWNKRAEEITGYAAGEVLGKECFTFAERPCRERCGLYAEGERLPVINRECTIRRKDGREAIISKNCDVLRDRHGTVIGGIESFEDITVRKKIEEDLRDSREAYTVDKFKMESMVESMVEGVIMLDEKDEVTVCNPQARWMLGFGSKETLTSCGVHDKMKALGLQEAFAECRSGKVSVMREVVGPQKHIFRCEMMPVGTGAGAVMGTVIVLKDITKEKEIDRMKTEFVSTVSHELRTPLAITKEGISVVLDRVVGEISEPQRKVLTTAKDNIDRLARIVNDLLDISRIEAGRIEIRRERVVMQGLVGSQIAAFGPRAAEKRIALIANMPPEPVSVYADSDRIAQVLTNLIGNALKFTEAGSVEIAVRELDGVVECAVADTGRGISKEDLLRAFNKFQQFGRASGAGEKGTGLGLSIAKGIVEAHKGAIRMESEQGKGTKVIFTLPAYVPATLIREYVAEGIDAAKKDGTKVSLLVVSLCDFERLKKDFAEEKMSPVIRGVERVIERSLRRTGDLVLKDIGQIVVLLDECGRASAQRIEERLREALKKHLAEEGLSGTIRIQFGLATYPDEATTEDALIEKASTLLKEPGQALPGSGQ